MNKESDARAALDLFGLYKAEWLNGALFELYTTPEYFDQLKTNRPCALIGGRGTGKTTVLRGLSYEGRYALDHDSNAEVKDWPYYGLYYRVNTNRVSAFRGPELSSAQWMKCFAHYFNLLLCGLLLDFVEWYQLHTSNRLALPPESLSTICVSLNVSLCDSLSSLRSALEHELIRFESSINNVGDAPPTGLSLQGAPVDRLADALISLPELHHAQFFFLIDEYENFDDHQQQVVNTVIKHVRRSYTFKIGVRELGWRVRATLNSNEVLASPADYERIDLREELSGKRFRTFAERVCRERLRKVSSTETPISISRLFPSLTDEEEARLLGVEEILESLKESSKSAISPEHDSFLQTLSLLDQFVVFQWATTKVLPLPAVIDDCIQNSQQWKDRFNNYRHAALFAIRARKRGIRKHYCGWETFCRLADGNIRFLMELVHQSLLEHFERGAKSFEPIRPTEQTLAAIAVGKKNLAELEGVSVDGARLTKLLLGLGRVFEVMAALPFGHTPEVTQFEIYAGSEQDDPGEISEELDKLIRSAVMHQALTRSAGNKRANETDTRAYDYSIHPLYSPFFVFSSRKKRKMPITATELLELVQNSQEGIRRLLDKAQRGESPSLPDQLSLFSRFYSDERA